MPRTLDPITLGSQIVDQRGTVTLLFRELWEVLRNGFQFSPTVAGEPGLAKLGQTAALATTTLYTVQSAGIVRVNYALVRTVNDGVSSSLTVTVGWTQTGIPRTEVETAITEAAGPNQQSLSKPIYADANTDVTIAVAYASNTPNKATYDVHSAVELLS